MLSFFFRVSFELAGRCKLTQLMSHHEFCYIHRDKLVAVMHSKSVTHKIRRNRRAAAPCFDNTLFVFAFVHSQYLFFEVSSYIRTFFNRTSHFLLFSVCLLLATSFELQASSFW